MSIAHNETGFSAGVARSENPEAEVIPLFPEAKPAETTESTAVYDPMKDPATIACFMIASISMGRHDFVKRTDSTRRA